MLCNNEHPTGIRYSVLEPFSIRLKMTVHNMKTQLTYKTRSDGLTNARFTADAGNHSFPSRARVEDYKLVQRNNANPFPAQI